MLPNVRAHCAIEPTRVGLAPGLWTAGHALLGCAGLLDTGLCVLAGADFLGARALPPPDMALVQREGWIWGRAPVGTRG